MAMAIPAARVDVEVELERRRMEAALLQTKLDVDELNYRVKAVEEGTSELMPADDVWTSLETMGF
ncbi:MAG: hypothetical protein LBL86_00390 [Coriobacteriales bacterium]|jgi:hypothetical protein|nr:hypothetical protein [Coriobacteriales bacterium]